MVDRVAIPDNNFSQERVVTPNIVVIGDTHYAFGVQSGTFVYTKSTDGGDTFGSEVTIATSPLAFALSGSVWYEGWTDGDAGTLIHIGYTVDRVGGINAADGVYHRTLDTADDTLSGEVKAANPNVFAAPGIYGNSITKTPGGNLLITYRCNGGTGIARSTDGGTIWGDRADPWNADSDDGTRIDACIIRPANTADNNDANCFFYDEGTGQLDIREYDDDADTITPTLIDTVSNAYITGFFEAVPRHSDGHTILAYRDDVHDNAHDLLLKDINGGGSIVAMPNAYTAQTNRIGLGLCIDQVTGDIYVAHAHSNAGISSQDNFIDRLADGGGAFDGEVQNNTTTRDYEDCVLPLSMNASGGRVILLTHSNTNPEIHYVNPENSPLLGAAAAVFGPGTAQKLLLL